MAAQALALLPASTGGTHPGTDVLRRRVPTAVEHAAGPIARAHLEQVQAAVRAQRRAGLDGARQRLAAESARVAAQREALLRRASADGAAVAALDWSLEDLRGRATARETAALVEDDLVTAPPEVVAVAWVQGTSAAAAVAARAAAVELKAARLGFEGEVEAALPYAGYDLLVTPPEGQPRFVTVSPWNRLTAVEEHVLRNVGEAFEVAVEQEDT